MEGTDVCFGPVLGLKEAPHHAHNAARSTFIELDGVFQPAPAPRFSATPGSRSGSAAGDRFEQRFRPLRLGFLWRRDRRAQDRGRSL